LAPVIISGHLSILKALVYFQSTFIFFQSAFIFFQSAFIQISKCEPALFIFLFQKHYSALAQ
jgi:hypothetical protein